MSDESILHEGQEARGKTRGCLLLFFRSVWEIIITLVLYGVIFYAGTMTGIYFENNRLITDGKRVDKLEEKVRDINGRVTAIEAKMPRR
jgi:hypothetical protein